MGARKGGSPQLDPAVVFPRNDPYNMDLLVKFINSACKTERNMHGRLLPHVGLAPEVEPLVRDFFQYMETREEIEKGLRGTHPVYARALRLVIDFGEHYLQVEKRRISMFVASTWPATSALDKEQIFLHVLTHVIELSGAGSESESEKAAKQVVVAGNQDARDTEYAPAVPVHA